MYSTNIKRSYLGAYGSVAGKLPSSVGGEAKPMIAKSTQDGSAAFRSTSSATSSQVGDGDEGRYRNHPLYSEGPKADGLYHCPFTTDPSCGHKPTKLKCNYEYAESHLSYRCCRSCIEAFANTPVQQIHRLALEAFPLQDRILLQAGVLFYSLSSSTRKRGTRHARTW